MPNLSLDCFFAPSAIALLGASDRPGSVGQVLTRNLRGGGFAGKVMLVNPRAGTIDGEVVYASVADLPQPPDLAVIATPAEAAPGLIGDLARRGCRAAVVISAGFEGAGRAAALRAAMLAAATPHGLRIIGPNCLGLLSPRAGINASFAAAMPPAGSVALVAQSGAVAAAAMDWAPAHGVGFSHVVTVGDCVDVDVAEVLGHLAADAGTSVILLYLESVRDGAAFLQAARRAAIAKPLVVLKGGRSAAGAVAAFSHTGALAGAYAVYEAAFRQAGLLQVETLEALLQAGATFAILRGSGPGLAILTNGGGAGVLAVDALEALGERLVELSPQTLASLAEVAPANWSKRNPVDILGDAHPDLYRAALERLLAAREVDAVVVLNCPTAVADSNAAADAVVQAAGVRPRKPVLTAWLGGDRMRLARRGFGAANIPTYESPEDAVRAFAQLTGLTRRHPFAPLSGPPPRRDHAGGARKVVAAAIRAGRSILTDPEARQVLAAYGVAVLASVEVASPEAAGQAASEVGGRVALKILSRAITHKSDVGGVRLSLNGAAETEQAAREMLARVRAACPTATIDGFVVEAMAERPLAEEILAGIARDPTFGPVVMVGHGGIAVQVLQDRALGLAPIDRDLALDMIGRTRVSRLLAGYRDRPPADIEALSATLVALGQLAHDLPEVAELDINPLLCDADGVLAIDARIAICALG